MPVSQALADQGEVTPGCSSGEGRDTVTGKVKCAMFTLEKQIRSLSQKGH